MKTEIEIERKYIIYMPKAEDLLSMDSCTRDEIVQTYLNAKEGDTRRVRMRRSECGEARYFETVKTRLDRISCVEREREIDENEYNILLSESRVGSRPIIKTRYAFSYAEQVFEIDIYPEWKNSAIMETELENRDLSVEFPPFIRIIAEVSGDARYSNSGMAKSFPEEIV